MYDDTPSTTSRRIVLILALAIAASLGVGEVAPPVTVATSVQVVDESSSISGGAVAERLARRRIRAARRRSRRWGPRRLRLSLLRSAPRSVHGWTDPPLRGPPARRVT
jgi:hypothetical protein